MCTYVGINNKVRQSMASVNGVAWTKGNCCSEEIKCPAKKFLEKLVESVNNNRTALERIRKKDKKAFQSGCRVMGLG